MDHSSIFLRLLITVILGAVLGLETETREIEKKGKRIAQKEEKSRIGGVRTYTILSLIGGLTGIFFINNEFILVYLVFFALTLLVAIAYFQNIKLKEAFGMTTEIAIFITFILGFLTTSNLVPIEITLFTLVILAFFLSQKRGVGSIIDKIKHDELIDILKFGLITLVILPLLPDKTFTLIDILNFSGGNFSQIPAAFASLSIINPFRIWFIVVVITGINLLGYLLEKFAGQKRGIVLTAILGGIVSSTSSTVSFAFESSKSSASHSRMYAGAALISNAISFLTFIVLISVASLDLLANVFPVLISMFIIGFTIGFIIINSQKEKSTGKLIKINHSPFSIGPAIKFVTIMILLTLAVQLAGLLNSEIIALGITSVSGIAGLTAPTIAISELLNNGDIILSSAIVLFLSTNAFNFISKASIGLLQGSKVFAKTLLLGLLLTLLGNLAILIV